MITIVDYGLGNLGSVKNMLTKLGCDSVITDDPNQVIRSKKIILPGVGSFDEGMNQIKEKGLFDILNTKALDEKIPILGICLGAQLMTRSSEEGHEDGFSWFDAQTKKFNLDSISGKWPLPNIGWRDVKDYQNYKLLDSIQEEPRFYFVHSYYLESNDPEIVSLTSHYGIDFSCGLHKDNLHCVQFHPEKSHRFGFYFLEQFIKI